MHKALYFAFGVAVGAGASWYFWKEYHRKRADEEIQSVKDAFAPKKIEEGKYEKKEPQMTAEQIAYEKERQSKLQDYRALVRESGYQTRTSPKDLLEDIGRLCASVGSHAGGDGYRGSFCGKSVWLLGFRLPGELQALDACG